MRGGKKGTPNIIMVMPNKLGLGMGTNFVGPSHQELGAMCHTPRKEVADELCAIYRSAKRTLGRREQKIFMKPKIPCRQFSKKFPVMIFSWSERNSEVSENCLGKYCLEKP